MSFKNHEITFKSKLEVKKYICTHCATDEYCLTPCTTLEKIERFIERFGIDEFNRLYKGTYNEDIYKLMEDFSDTNKLEAKKEIKYD